ncbi:MAG: bifunctional nicotinamidase/pyrazinamidase [Acidobacteria bacterium]|nr:bifunctional nicotinamidase/pyrazinamidase [Acidobacteriota bacterium]
MTIQPTDVLIVIDLQVDFCPGGSLAVRDGNTIIPLINRLAMRFDHVVATQDWHPQGHISFASAHLGKQPFIDTVETPYGTQHLWPDHCVQNSAGAALHPDLLIENLELILRKGFRREIDSYSAFVENDKTTPTGLAGYLRERNLRRLFFVGLAYDYCVGSSALDGQRLGFECIVIEDATRGIAEDSQRTMRDRLDAAGVKSIQSNALA